MKRGKTKCKHYGMSHYGFPSNGNQCPLVENAFAPCAMAMQGQEPDWEKCLKNPELLQPPGGKES